MSFENGPDVVQDYDHERDEHDRSQAQASHPEPQHAEVDGGLLAPLAHVKDELVEVGDLDEQRSIECDLIPNPHARFPVTAGAAGGLTTKALGATGGAETVALSIAQLPSHNHTDLSHTHPAVSNGHAHSYSQPVSGGGVQFGIGGVGLGTVAGATAIGYDSITIDPGYANISYTGSGSPVATMPPWFAFNFIIKT